jgi:hypothetical protein
MDTLALSERSIDLTVSHGIRITVRECVVNQVMHVAAQQLIGRLETENPHACGIGKRAVAIEIDTIDPLTRRIQE